MNVELHLYLHGIIIEMYIKSIQWLQVAIRFANCDASFGNGSNSIFNKLLLFECVHNVRVSRFLVNVWKRDIETV